MEPTEPRGLLKNPVRGWEAVRTRESGRGIDRAGTGRLEAKPRLAPLGRKLKGEREYKTGEDEADEAEEIGVDKGLALTDAVGVVDEVALLDEIDVVVGIALSDAVVEVDAAAL